MPLHTIAHALITWQEDGQRRTVFHGETVDIPDDIAERFELLGAFEPEPTAGVEPVVDDEDESTTSVTPVVPETASEQPASNPVTEPDTAPAITVERPKAAAVRALWVEYATARGLDTDGLDKGQIITAINALDEQENQS